MKLLKNGELGIYVDSTYVESLNTVALLDEEIDNVVLGNFDPVLRKDDTVVDPNEYVEFLKLRKSQLIRALEQHASSESLGNKVSKSTQSDLINEVSNSTQSDLINEVLNSTQSDLINEVSDSTQSDLINEISDLKKQLNHSKMIIKKLMELVKNEDNILNS